MMNTSFFRFLNIIKSLDFSLPVIHLQASNPGIQGFPEIIGQARHQQTKPEEDDRAPVMAGIDLGSLEGKHQGPGDPADEANDHENSQVHGT